ncbi:MAG: Helicase associated domain protein [Verrucomicrobia bacterium]|nr:Helicase associated domain protein [Verrucomicrobiota bacterium]
MSGPLHPKAKELFKAGLYSGLSSFEELEKRIAAFDDDKRKGDSFEVFAEAYLATQRKHDAAKVWPLTAVPLEILQRLGLSEQDYGVDGVFQTLLGNHNAYQVKFRSARPPLTWRELSTFMGLADSPQIHSRILITNCDELPSVLNERRGFFCIRGSDLGRLEVGDFRAIEAWLAESAFETPKKEPQPHQTEALAVLLPALQEHDRVSAIMACGTGKTLVALWTAERLQASRILVLLPSLALLRQTLHEWLRETRLPELAYLCVCSDPTVKENVDALTPQQSDLDFEVSTDSDTVRRFLDAAFDGTKVVFSTYQSASVVGHAMKPGEMFDLGVFDEAHKTAGREGRNYAFALADSNIPIRKRLFVTATQRHYNPHQRDQEGEAQLVFSMDNPAVYGPQAYILTFGEAARRDIICGYKVIISVITSEMVTNELLSRGEVLVNGDAVRARQVANQVALRDAIQKYGVGKIFTFHNTVKSAASFVADGSEGIRTHLPDFGSYHVNGTMPTAQRERVMHEFRGAARAVMSNARCLTEGVDVPAVDMVAFLSPRRSRVDIVQATGRAMRRSPGKSLGYVLVPLYVELAAGESVGDAVSRADFDEVWDVLQSLQEQDEILAELIRYVGEQKGRGKGFDDRGFADRIDFGGARLELKTLREAVTTRSFECLYPSWSFWVGKLRAFKERFGHCKVPSAWEEDETFASWASRTRNKCMKGLLSRQQIKQLNDIGFVWEAYATSSLASDSKLVKALKRFQKRFGHCNVPIRHPENPRLARWVASIRNKQKRGALPDKLLSCLNELGFVWNYQTQKTHNTWMKWYQELEKYTREHGNPHVPHGHSNSKLASWVWIQRTRRDRSYGAAPPLTDEQVALLNKLGFRWDVREEQWMENFERLKEFKAKHGHCEVVMEDSHNSDLRVWANRQRLSQARGELERSRKAMLDGIGFNLESQMNMLRWREMYERLKQYHAEHGDADVPNHWKKDPQLAGWVLRQRQSRKKGALSQEQVQLLDAIGFTWQHRERGTWEDRLAEVAAFKAKHGHCDIPTLYPEMPKLGPFVNAMRSQRNSGRLSADRIAKLDALGFAWASTRSSGEDGMSTAWKVRYDELLRYRERHGDCDVPTKRSENEQLGNWVSRQRQSKKQGRLHPDQVKMLEEIGFTWEVAGPRQPTQPWEVRYAELMKFKDTHGNCDVPVKYPKSSTLGAWLSSQRQRKKRGKLGAEHERLLNEIGFNWGISVEPWEARYAELLQFKESHGHCNVPVRYSENPRLGVWVVNQRQHKKRGKLRPEREWLLNDLGFIWGKSRRPRS